MPTLIVCPNCKNEFAPEDAIARELEKEYANKLKTDRDSLSKQFSLQQQELAIQQSEFDEKKKKENELFAEKVQKEKQKMEVELQEQLRKSIGGDFENQLKMLKESNQENEEKLVIARQKEMEFLKKEQVLKNKEADLEIQLLKRLQEERSQVIELIRKQETEKNSLKETEHQMIVKELGKQLEDQRKLAEEMRRKADQGSMQLQGEAQEFVLEDKLREYFPFDTILEVGKGVEGADCMMIVRNSMGDECGKIIFESKRTKSWNNIWLDKLKNDMRNKQADLAILVSQVFPKGMDCFGERDGVWLCSFKELPGLASALRNAIIRIAESKKSEENKGEKMQMLYNYLTGLEFRQQIEAIVEGFVAMKNSISKERIQMEKSWKEREKQLDKVLLNTSGMYGSIKGIAGASVQNIPLLEGTSDNEDDMAH
ncbi:MAG: DUF2130 domain-containing protein [Ginsengibacter sp.]